MGFKAKLLVKQGTIPKFCKARSVPFATKGAIEGKLDRLEAAGFMERETHGDWAATILAVPKKDGGFRIGRDYKVTINRTLDIDQYPLPNPSKLLLNLFVTRNLLSLTNGMLIITSAESGVNQVCYSQYS